MAEWYNNSWNYVVKELSTDIYRGLNVNEIEDRRAKYGDNRINIKNIKSFIRIFLLEVLNLWTFVFIGNIILSFYLKNIIIGSMLIVFLLLTLTLNAFRKYNDQASFKTLEKLNSTMATVIRSGKVSSIKCDELVVGDVVLLDKNFVVPADLRIVESENLKIKETVVTGENYISEKYETKIEEKDIPLSEMKNIAFKGSVVTDGTGTGVVIATGVNTQIGQIVDVLIYDDQEKNDLNTRINNVLNKLVLFFVLLTLISTFSYYIYIKDVNKLLSLINSLLLVSIPEGIAIIIFIFLYSFHSFLKSQGIEIKNLSSLEILCNTDVMLIDKIGAFSEKEMMVESIYTDGMYHEKDEQDIIKDTNVERIFQIGLLCNDGSYNSETGIGRGDLIDVSLIKFAEENSVYKRKLELEYRRVLEISYDTDKRIFTTINKIDENYRANVKGPVDVLLDKCTHIMKNGIEKEISEEDINEIRAADIEISNKGLRTVGFAYRSFNYKPTLQENIESNLVFVGIIGFYNPLRDNVGEILKNCRKENIKPIIITDDNKLTAYSIGKNLNLINSHENILSGIELKYMEKEELIRNIEKISILSRIDASQKTEIVKTIKDKEHMVLSTGENMTELPAMNASDIGLGIGENCSFMIKKLSDIYIKEDYLNKLLDLVSISETIFNNINKAAQYIILCTFIEFLFILCGALLNLNIVNDIHVLIMNAGLIPLCVLNILLLNSEDDVETLYRTKIDKSMVNFKSIFCSFFKSIFLYVIIYGVYYLNNKYSSEWSILSCFIIIIFSMIIFSYTGNRKRAMNKKLSSIFFIISILIAVFLVLLKGIGLNINFSIKALLIDSIAVLLIYFIIKKMRKESYY